VASFSCKNPTHISLLSQLMEAMSVPTTYAANIFLTALKLPLYFYTNVRKQDENTVSSDMCDIHGSQNYIVQIHDLNGSMYIGI
jgi:hypothetical protein